MVTAIIIELETNPFVGAMLKDEFLQDFKQFLTDLKEQDLQRLIRVAQPALA